MLTYKKTSIFQSSAQTVVNTVNTVGVMGKGIAAEFKARYPEMFKAYKKLCDNKALDIGQLWLWKAPNQWVLNFPTKRHWRNPSRLEYIEAGLKKFTSKYEERGITEISFPRLGCGNGGLSWKDVRPLMEHYLADLPIPVFIHDFEHNIGTPEHLSSQPALEHFGEMEGRSFHTFLSDIDRLAHVERLSTDCSDGLVAQFTLSPDNCLLISTGLNNHQIDTDELYELWSALRKAPLTQYSVTGSARDVSLHLFRFLDQLPYIQTIHIGSSDNERLPALEFAKVSEKKVSRH